MKPYADLARAIALAVVVMLVAAMLFIGGVSAGKGQAAKALAATVHEVAAKDVALGAAAAALRGAANVLRDVERQAQARIARERDAKRDAERAGIAAAAAEHAAKAKLAEYQRREHAARRNPGCAELLDTDVVAVCGL
ncbi:hypothetical protein [Lysobacter olei]